MKKVIVTTLASSLVATIASAGTSVTADFASAYVFRGTTVVDDLVVQPGIEVDGFGLKDEYGSIDLGVWGSTAPFWDTYDNLHETDWYAAYTLPEIVSNLNLNIGFTEYQYAGGAGEQEVNLGAAYALCENISIGGRANFMIDDEVAATESQKYFDMHANYSKQVSEELDVSLGALLGVMVQGDGNASAGLDDGFNQYELSGAFNYALNEMWSVGGALTYIGQIDDNVLTDAAYDRGLVATFSVGCSM